MPTEKNIKTPEALYKHFEDYKKECKLKPRIENIPAVKELTSFAIEREKPLTWDGFEIYLRKNKILAKLDDYKADKDGRYTEYADIIRAIHQEIYEDKYTGAVVGIYSNNIIARDLGLTDKKDINQSIDLQARVRDIFPDEDDPSWNEE